MKTRIEVAGDVGQIVLDDPGQKVHTLGREMLRELGEASTDCKPIRRPRPS